MEMCMLHNLDHRKYKPTGFPKTKFPLEDILTFLNGQTTGGNTLKQNASYPNLAKKASDGKYCYIVQRRISLYISLFCVRKGISANTATWIDMLFAILAFFLLTLATIKADLRILTGVFIGFFFNFIIAETVIMQALNQKFAFYSLILLHLLCLYDAPFLINQYYRRLLNIIFDFFEDNSYFLEKEIVQFAKIHLEKQLINNYQ